MCVCVRGREREAHENNETRETNYNWCSEFHDQKMKDVLSRKYCTYQLVEAHRQKLLERGSPSYRSASHAHCGHAHLLVQFKWWRECWSEGQDLLLFRVWVKIKLGLFVQEKRLG